MKFRLTLDKLGVDFLPDLLKSLAAFAFLLAPVIAALVCLKYTQENSKPEHPKEEIEEQQPEEQKLIRKRKR